MQHIPPLLQEIMDVDRELANLRSITTVIPYEQMTRYRELVERRAELRQAAQAQYGHVLKGDQHA